MVPHSGPSSKGLVFWTIFLVCMICCNGQGDNAVDESITEEVTEIGTIEMTNEMSTEMTTELTTRIDFQSPEEIMVSKNTNDSIEVVWNQTNAGVYNISWQDKTNSIINSHFTNETKFKIDNLKSGNWYDISVSGCEDEDRCNSKSASVIAITKPNQPLKLISDVSQANQLNISWTACDSVLNTSHTVTVESNGTVVENETVDGSLTFETGYLEPGTLYEVEVKCTVKESPYPSSEATYVKTYTYPAAVDKDTIKIVNNSDWTFINWTESSTLNHLLVVYDGDEEKCMNQVYYNNTMSNISCNIDLNCANVPLETETGSGYNTTDTEPCGNYRAELYAVNEAGCSNGTKVPFTNPPAAPKDQITGLNFIDISSKSMNVSWTNISNPGRCEMTYTVTYNFTDCSSKNEKTEKIPPTNKTSVFVDGLEAYTNYTFTISAHTTDAEPGRSPSEPKTQRTDEDLPGKPENIKYHESNRSLTWDFPECDKNGVIQNYSVDYRCHETDRENKTNRGQENVTEQFLMWNVTAFTTCEVNITAITIDYGEPAHARFNTSETPASKVTNVVVSIDEEDGLKLGISWKEPEIAAGPTEYLVCVSEEDKDDCQDNRTVVGLNATIKVTTYYWNYTVKVVTVVAQDNGDISKATSEKKVVETGKSEPVSISNLTYKNTGEDCRKVSLNWIALEKRQINGVFKNYTIHVKEDNGNRDETHAVTNHQTNSISLILDGGRKYNGTIFAVNDVGESGHSNKLEIRTKTCAPVLEDTGADLIEEYKKYDGDTQRTFKFLYNDSLFENDSFGYVKGRGFIVLDVTVNNEKSSNKSQNFTAANFNSTYKNKWKDYDTDDKNFYRINKNANGVQSKKQKRSASASLQEYTLGLEGGADSCENDYCNGYLKPGRKYKLQMFSCTCGGCVLTADANILAETEPPTDNTTAIVVGVIVPLVVIAILVIGAVVFSRKAGNQRARPIALGTSRGHANAAFELKEPQPSPVLLNKFQEKVTELHRDSDLKFSEEYKLLKEIAPKNPWHAAEYPENRSKNRFTNILPFDHSRVKLLPVEDEDNGDYINANYMPGYNSKREFIAAQGPLPGTKDDYWRMIWEQNVHTIIMLTRCLERGRPKCDQYWPADSGEPIYYGDLECELKSESTLHNYSIRIFEVAVGDRTRTIKQMHFTTWPDHGCPESTEDLLSFVQHVRQHVPYKAKDQGPILVHCSAGVGRTGTWICVDRLLQHIKDHEDVDIFGTVLEMRQYRCNMVQTEDQYIYIHDCIADAIQRGMHESSAGYTIRTGPEGEEEEANLYENVEVKANGSVDHA